MSPLSCTLFLKSSVRKTNFWSVYVTNVTNLLKVCGAYTLLIRSFKSFELKINCNIWNKGVIMHSYSPHIVINLSNWIVLLFNLPLLHIFFPESYIPSIVTPNGYFKVHLHDYFAMWWVETLLGNDVCYIVCVASWLAKGKYWFMLSFWVKHFYFSCISTLGY